MKKTVFQSLFTALLAMGIVSCATTVPIKSVRMPTIDTTGIQRLGIRPFENVSGIGGPVTAQLTRYLSDKATVLITDTGKFTVVAPTDPNADGVFTGELTIITSKDSQEVKEAKDKDGNPYTQITYKRDVSIEFSYSILSARTDMPVGKVLKKGSISSSSMESPGELSDTLTLAKSIVDSQISGLSRDIVPYIVTGSRELMKETLKDKVVKQKMKTALTLVKNGSYEEAIRQYDIIAYESGSAAASANAGILRQSIASDIAANARLSELFNDKSGLTEKAIKTVLDALNSKLPSGTNISIMKTRSTERDMIDYAVDQLTKNIIQAGNFTVIDRSNQALIDDEQYFQLSGNVSDESAVSIGKQLGVRYMVLCWISGEKSLRRFYTRVLDIETAQIA
ncbi:MAG: penicillin-binding protein activator LpoB [Treponema sp.]|jgi:CO dehydrogenase/acetyl-CoA synthase epsilon subunit|nr:penicillin-binding protein activator LpoB [Treponema sp.]